MAAEMTCLLSTQSLLLLLSFIASSFCAPAIDEEILYDQRQNGTENYRVRINDIVIVQAPLEALVALVSAAGETALQQHGTTSSTTRTDLVGPSTESTSAVNMTTEAKPKQGSNKPHTKSK
jgi:hypothetical protein